MRFRGGMPAAAAYERRSSARKRVQSPTLDRGSGPARHASPGRPADRFVVLSFKVRHHGLLPYADAASFGVSPANTRNGPGGVLPDVPLVALGSNRRSRPTL